MYTIVLAAFLTTGSEVPDFGRRGGCHGCGGGGCYGCWGGGCYGGWGGGCYGGCGGCWGGGWACYGCGGGCFGCGGGCGGMMAMAGGGCSGSQGGGGGGGSGAAGGRGGVGMQGGGGGGGGGSQGGGGGSADSLRELKKSVEALKKEQTQLRLDALKITAEELRRRETDQKIDELRRDLNEMRRRMPPGAVPPPNIRRELPPPQPGKVMREAPAHIIVRLPADARLTVHGVECPLTSDTRTFDTPALAPGQTFYYILKAEIKRDGRSIAQTRRVDFRSGENITVSFDNLGSSLVTAR